MENKKHANEHKLITVSGVTGYIDENGVAQLKLEHCARGLGFTQEKNGVEYVRWETVSGYMSDIGFSQHLGKEDFIPENIFYRLAFKASNKVATDFQAIVADEILPAIRKQGYYIAPNAAPSVPFPELVASVDIVAQSLRVNDASKIGMYRKLYESLHLPTDFLPAYEYNNNRQLKSATALLQEHNLPLKAPSFNKLMLEHGFLEERTRPSSKSGTKKFKALTEAGLKFGENAISPHNQHEVQPNYYEDAFDELFGLLQ